MNSIDLVALAIIVLVAWVVLSIALSAWEEYSHDHKHRKHKH